MLPEADAVFLPSTTEPTLDTLLRLHRFSLGYLFQQLQGIPGEMVYRAQGEMNSPGWCVGHLAVEGDQALLALDVPRITPTSWDALFLMDAAWPGAEGAPSLGELMTAMRAVYRRLGEIVATLPADRLAEPSHSDFLRPYLPTRGEWLAHMLTTHVAMHAGGLAAWRRVHGLGPARRADTRSAG